MSDSQIINCPGCGSQFEITREYIEQFGGQETACSSCGKAMGLPRTWEEFIGTGQVTTLAYAGPEFTNKRGRAQHWMEDGLLVIEKGADLVPWCVLCGAEAPHPHIARTVKWSQSARDARTSKGELLMSLTDSTRMRVRLGLCARHLARRRMNGVLGLACALVGVAVVAAGLRLAALADYKQVIIPVGVLVILSGLIWAAASRNILSAVYVDRWQAKLTGASPKFLEKVPERESRVRPPNATSAPFDQIQ